MSMTGPTINGKIAGVAGSAPARHHFSVEDYYRMAEAGILTPDARVELLDGQIFDMLPIGPFHASASRRLNNFFARLGEGRWLVDMQNPVRLNSRSEPQPDIALLRPLDAEYALRHPMPEDVFLLVEVAESSVRYDRGRKLAAYARAGIVEYWIVNLVEGVVEVYRQPLPTERAYQSITRVRGEARVAPTAFPDAEIAVADLLGR